MNLRKLAGLVFSISGVAASPVQAIPAFEVFTGGFKVFLGINDNSAEIPFTDAMNRLGLDTGSVDFETLPDGVPTAVGVDSGRFPLSLYPVVYSIGLPISVSLSSKISNIADLALSSTGSPNSVATQNRISGDWGVLPNGAFDLTAPITANFGGAVSASGVWLTGIDNFSSEDDATVTWHFADGSSHTESFNNTGRVENRFFGLITYSDLSKSSPSDEIIRMSFSQLGGNSNNADDIVVGRTAAKPIPEPLTGILSLISLGVLITASRLSRNDHSSFPHISLGLGRLSRRSVHV